MDLHRLPDTYLTNYVQNVFAVTPRDVQRIAQKYLLSDQMTIVVVGDKSKIADQLTPQAARLPWERRRLACTKRRQPRRIFFS